ncbi:MAG: chemotaxis protein CheW [Treponema sp.]|nr:chemotaxis protein CheW [Treponema sp.]
MQATTSKEIPGTSFLVFSIREKLYAINTSFVQEILHSAKIHPLPFVPPYIEGLVNCRGTPYTVVNAALMKGEENYEVLGDTVLVFKREDDQLALHISNIELFFEPDENDIKADGIRYKLNLIPYFDADDVENTLRKDLREKES